MLLESNNVVTAEEFRKEPEKYMAAARKGDGPVAIVQDTEIIGVFIGREDYDEMFGAAVKSLLASRMKGPTVSHEQAEEHIRNVRGCRLES